MTIENEAFIDIEQTLHNRTNAKWVKLWREMQGDLNRLANEGKWDEAHKLADTLDLDDLVDDSITLATTLAEAAMFLGASRIVDNPREATFFGDPDQLVINQGIVQWSTVLGENAREALRLQLHIALGDLEREHAEKDMIIKAPTLASVGKQGTQFSRATASLMISRMSTAGFMAQAQASGIQEYVVSEVMDSVTCPICATMHGKRFPVAQGAARIGAIMLATDANAMRAIAPFPSQSATNIKRLQGLDQTGLIHSGMELPPYHPYCRGITTLEIANQGSALSLGVSSSGVSSGRLLHSSEDLTPDQLASRLFGDFDDLDNLFVDGILGVGALSTFGSEQEE